MDVGVCFLPNIVNIVSLPISHLDSWRVSKEFLVLTLASIPIKQPVKCNDRAVLNIVQMATAWDVMGFLLCYSGEHTTWYRSHLGCAVAPGHGPRCRTSIVTTGDVDDRARLRRGRQNVVRCWEVQFPMGKTIGKWWFDGAVWWFNGILWNLPFGKPEGKKDGL